MLKNVKKRGITLFALVLTIAISLILVTGSIGAITNVVSNNRISSFVEEMSMIENQVELYYIQNKIIPSNGAVLDKTQIIELVNLYNNGESTTVFENQLQDELNLNGDNNAIAFYQLDFSKIDIDRSFNKDDVYVVAYPSLHVYYLKGMGAKRNVYFSISSRINGGNIVRNNEISTNDEEIVSIVESSGVKMTKKNGSWSNKLGITIDTFMDSGEKLYVVFNEKEVLLNTKSGQKNIISFDTLLSNVENGLIVSSNTTTNFNEEDLISLSSVSPSARYIGIVKKDSSGNVISKNKVNTFNFDAAPPELDKSKTKINSLEESNEIILYANDLQSGVKEIRYEYFKTYDRVDGKTGESYYYSGNEIDKEYLKYNGKIAKAENDGKVSISLPKGISSIKVIVVDNVNNISNLIELNTTPENSIYYSLSDISQNSISIFFYGTSITSGTLMYGTNSKEYSKSINWNAEQTVNINNLSNTDDKLYLKVKSGNSTRLIVLDDMPKTTLGTNLKEKSKWYKPYIPNGFIHTEGTVEEGFVIQDVSDTSSKYNEFVWIPVDGLNIKFGKEEFGIGTIASFQNILIDNENSFNETSLFANNIEQSVEKYGGFYVARYEASKDESDNVRSIKDASVWNNISYQAALERCNAMYSYKNDIKTTIMSAGIYDTIMKWLSYSKYNVTKESNTNNLIGNFGSSINLTGSNENFAMNNIYDLAGNVAELTSETYKSYPVFRGGAFNSTGVNMVASVRAYNNTSHVLDTIGFRPIMYII